MSGTSLDGVDVGLIETDGETITNFGATATYSYSESERNILRQALQEAVNITQRNQRFGILQDAEALITQSHILAVKSFLKQYDLEPQQIDVIGFHGQTVLHRPEKHLTVQLGCGQSLATTTGIPVINDFRGDDVAAGGQGAPLVPTLHKALILSRSDISLPCAVVNIGGVANITWITTDRDPIACDVGPGNALLDDFMFTRTGVAMDHNGRHAAKGVPEQKRINEWLTHPFFSQPWPKSLDRQDFKHVYVSDMSLENGAATLTAFTAQAIARMIAHLPEPPQQWLICGGGAYNPTLMDALKSTLNAPVTTTDAFDWPADGIEACAFAFLAVRALEKLPLTYPTTTGVKIPLSGGRLWQTT